MKITTEDGAEWTPGRIYDTVAIPLPAAGGSSFALFRDLADKSEALTNLRQTQRLPNGVKMKVEQVHAELRCWSGDDMAEMLKQVGYIHLKVNRRRLLEIPLRMVTYLATECDIVDSDDISGFIGVGMSPWPTPQLVEWTEKKESHDEALKWPASIKRFDAFNLLPTRHRTKSFYEPKSRPKQGTVTVTVYLNGQVKEPVK